MVSATALPPGPALDELTSLRAHNELNRKRSYAVAAQEFARGVAQTEIARRLGVSQPTVSNMVSRYRNDPARYARSPLDVILERAAGKTTQTAMLEQLVSWTYSDTVLHDSHRGELAESIAVSDLSDLTTAVVEQLISEQEYRYVMSRIPVG